MKLEFEDGFFLALVLLCALCIVFGLAIGQIKKRPPQKLQLIRRISSRMRMAEWKQDRDFVRAARKFLSDPEFLVIVDVLKNESPANFTMFQATLEERAIQQARSEGYSLCLNNLESLGIYQKAQQQIEPTFEQPDEEQQP